MRFQTEEKLLEAENFPLIKISSLKPLRFDIHREGSRSMDSGKKE